MLRRFVHPRWFALTHHSLHELPPPLLLRDEQRRPFRPPLDLILILLRLLHLVELVDGHADEQVHHEKGADDDEDDVEQSGALVVVQPRLRTLLNRVDAVVHNLKPHLQRRCLEQHQHRRADVVEVVILRLSPLVPLQPRFAGGRERAGGDGCFHGGINRRGVVPVRADRTVHVARPHAVGTEVVRIRGEHRTCLRGRRACPLARVRLHAISVGVDD